VKLFKIAVGVAVFSGVLALPSLGGPNKFGDLPLNTKFDFLADTNHTYPWTKISATSGSNTVNRAVVTISAPTVVDS
jgi:hypothetical protein